MHRCLICVLGYGGRVPEPGSLQRLAGAPDCSGMVVFWNQPSEEVAAILHALAAASDRIETRISSDNLGSAGGYSRLLEWAETVPGWQYLLLLDDDLVLEPESLSRLVECAARDPGHAQDTLYMAYRRDLSELLSLVEFGQPLADIRPGACLGFHVLNLARLPARHSSHVDEDGIRLDAAPYGGLLVPRPAVSRLGKPMESLFLYADDAELTLRFTRAGGVIRLVPEAVVSDRYPSWNATASRGGNLARRTLHMDDSKAYYEARNRNYLSRRFYPGHAAAYAINKAIFLGSLYLVAILNFRLGRARLIHRALNDGEAMAARDGAPIPAASGRGRGNQRARPSGDHVGPGE